jgi:dihydroxy-acid dehydratase
VQDGDLIELDAHAGRLHLLVDEREIQRRLAAWQPPEPKYTQGYRALWVDQVLQAPDGCDFRFCVEEDWLLKQQAGRERRQG